MEKPTQSTQVVPRLWGDYVLGENQNKLDPYNQMVGNCISSINLHIGTWVHNIGWNLGQGAKLIQATWTFVQIINFFENTSQRIVWLSLGANKLVDF
jgi:ribosomal protein L2